MPPHGGSFAGASHSHDVQFPDDTWNLYSMLDPEGVTALNATHPEQALGIFKPHVHRLTEQPEIISDADPELLVVVRFTSPVHIRKIMIIGGGIPENHPSSLKCYVNHENIDFTNLEALRPAQEFRLPVNEEGTVELTTVLRQFTNVTTMAFFFPTNYGDENTVIKYIGMQGDHTHYRREAVDTFYEVLCTGHDISQPNDQGAANLTSHMH